MLCAASAAAVSWMCTSPSWFLMPACDGCAGDGDGHAGPVLRQPPRLYRCRQLATNSTIEAQALLAKQRHMAWHQTDANAASCCRCDVLHVAGQCHHISAFVSAGVVKMRRGLTAKYMVQLVSMRDVYEAFDFWAVEIDTRAQRVRFPLRALTSDEQAPSPVNGARCHNHPVRVA